MCAKSYFNAAHTHLFSLYVYCVHHQNNFVIYFVASRYFQVIISWWGRHQTFPSSPLVRQILVLGSDKLIITMVPVKPSIDYNLIVLIIAIIVLIVVAALPSLYQRPDDYNSPSISSLLELPFWIHHWLNLPSHLLFLRIIYRPRHLWWLKQTPNKMRLLRYVHSRRPPCPWTFFLLTQLLSFIFLCLLLFLHLPSNVRKVKDP